MDDKRSSPLKLRDRVSSEPANAVLLLRNRQLGVPSRESKLATSRRFYTTVCPNSTVYDVRVPPVVLRKFSRDGQFFLCFSRGCRAVQIYRFKGAAGPAGAKTLDAPPSEENAFAHFFVMLHDIELVHFPAKLCRDFCLFTSDDKHVILASSTPLEEEGGEDSAVLNYAFHVVDMAAGVVRDSAAFPSDVINLTNHCGVYLHKTLFGVLSLHEQIIHLLQIKGDGHMIPLHRISLNSDEEDELILAQHPELSGLRSREPSPTRGAAARRSRTSPVVAAPAAAAPPPPAAPRQAARRVPPQPPAPTGGPNDPIVVVDPPSPRGRYRQLGLSEYELGVLLSADHEEEDDDAALPMDVERRATADGPDADGPPPFAGLRQRLLTFVFHQARNSPDSASALRDFYYRYRQYASLVIWRFQFLDDTHLLIKFGSLEGAGSRRSDHSQRTAFFAVYDIAAAEIKGVFENNSAYFVRLYDDLCEFFHPDTSYASSFYHVSYPSNNLYTRESVERQKLALFSSQTAAGSVSNVKRMVWALPCSPQLWSLSPYFDQSLFVYDEKLISAADRPKPCMEFPIKFYSRRHRDLRFKIDPNGPRRGDATARETKYASYVFHPNQPFVMSIQYISKAPAVVNFHYYS